MLADIHKGLGARDTLATIKKSINAIDNFLPNINSTLMEQHIGWLNDNLDKLKRQVQELDGLRDDYNDK